MVQHMNLREYIDKLRIEGYTVQDAEGEDPVLITPDGKAVETWRQGYPYEELLDRETYDEEKYKLQVELLKFQYWSQEVGAKHVLVFEGATPPARAARSSGSWSTSTRAQPGSSR
ncbi:hypothetical protein GCM10025872_07160 [Barrientosiimonas endolithica]|uniref:Uncharacterized protein n=1 Tax=Barrientosiimonas endolithica TaxID=1535208 RepID=A0ABN6YI04_9MICO|nr:hypothetical protein GCM10025872_07160 [Barrientosiimonas endolithica]